MVARNLLLSLQLLALLTVVCVAFVVWIVLWIYCEFLFGGFVFVLWLGEDADAIKEDPDASFLTTGEIRFLV